MNSLRLQTKQMHFNSLQRSVIESTVRKLRQIKITPKFSIRTSQQVEVEGIVNDSPEQRRPGPAFKPGGENATRGDGGVTRNPSLPVAAVMRRPSDAPYRAKVTKSAISFSGPRQSSKQASGGKGPGAL